MRSAKRTSALAIVGIAGMGTCGGLDVESVTELAGPGTALAAEAELKETACGTTGPELTVALGHLKHICPRQSDAVSKGCMAALEERYWTRPVLCHAHANPGDGAWQPIWWPQPRNDALVWQEAFEDPSALRAAVQAAVRNRACRLRESEFRPDLRQTCAADAMARLGVLHGACQYALYMERGWRFEGWERERASPQEASLFDGWQTYWEEQRIDAETLQNESNKQQVAVQQEAELHHAWRIAKCRAVPKAALAPLRELRPPSVYTGSPVDQRDLLVVAAARLGSEWALTVGTALNRAGSHGNVAVETWRDAPLPLAYIHWSHHAGAAYLLAARQVDLASDAPRFDWRGWERGLEDAYGPNGVAAAVSTVETIRSHGWPPCCTRELGNSPWPWSDLPTPARTKVVRRRIDESGNVRWVYQNGREEWVEDNVTHSTMPNGETWVTYDSRVGSTVLRRWIDDEGTERWLDEWGDEHWIEVDGTEHWIELDGTEWILLPPEQTGDEERLR